MSRRVVKITLGAAAILIGVVLAGLFFSFGYERSISFTDVAQDRARLINGIESYWNIQELQNHLKESSLAWKVEQGQQPGSNDKRPPFVIDTVKISKYTHLGLTGELHVVLFNNRTVSTHFFPKEINRYINELRKIKRVDLIQHQEIKLSQHARLWRAEAGREKRRYVGWEDIRLSDEMSTWIKRYS